MKLHRSDHHYTITFKKRKLQRKLYQKNEINTKEVREGVTYSSGVALSHVSDETQIPPSQLYPEMIPLSDEQAKNKSIVFCDIETTSLHSDTDIVQIAAVCGLSKFNQYITPTKPFTQFASSVTELTSYGNTLLYQGKPVHSVPLKNGLENFLSWLKPVQPCILIGHNFHKFDLPRIIRAFQISNLTDDFQAAVIGCVDSYPMFKKLFPDLEKYSQEYLVSVLSKEKYKAHNALSDVESLQNLCATVGVGTKQMIEFSCTIESSLNKWVYTTKSNQNEQTLAPLTEYGVLSKGMSHKIAFSGLKLDHLKLAVQRSGLDGLSQLLTEKMSGKPRVTNRKNIIEKLFDFLKD